MGWGLSSARNALRHTVRTFGACDMRSVRQPCDPHLRLFAYGFGVDLVRIDGVLIAAVIMASALTVWAIIKPRDVRATATALFRRSYRPT